MKRGDMKLLTGRFDVNCLGGGISVWMVRVPNTLNVERDGSREIPNAIMMGKRRGRPLYQTWLAGGKVYIVVAEDGRFPWRSPESVRCVQFSQEEEEARSIQEDMVIPEDHGTPQRRSMEETGTPSRSPGRIGDFHPIELLAHVVFITICLCSDMTEGSFINPCIPSPVSM